MNARVPCLDNVHLDAASAYKWEELNETEFLGGLFACLKAVLGHEYYEYSFYVFSSHDSSAMPASASLEGDKKILFFISDESSGSHAINCTLKLQPYYRAIFKSYLPYELPYTRVHPFQPGYVKGTGQKVSLKEAHLRRYDLFFAGCLNGNRLDFYRALNPLARVLPSPVSRRLLRWMSPELRRLTLDRFAGATWRNSLFLFTNGFKYGLPLSEYSRILYESKIVLCPRGFTSRETFRHMEALRAGCVVISEELPQTVFLQEFTDHHRRELGAGSAVGPGASGRSRPAWQNPGGNGEMVGGGVL